MVFSSPVFLFVFLPVMLTVCFLFRVLLKNRSLFPENIWLLATSLLFYAWSKPSYLFILLFSILINYAGALFIASSKTARREKTGLIVTVTLNLLLLFYFKYFNYTIFVLNKYLFSRAGTQLDLTEVLLPVGISFFTFQGLSYVADVYKKRVPAQNTLYKLAMYISMFPQLVAGPIVRYKDIAAEIDDRRVVTDDLAEGIKRFVIGLSKKIILADSMAAVVDQVFANKPEFLSPAAIWVGAAFYTMQIYFDFSGYSDMAIGLGRMLGFHFTENFNYPYIATSITDFWKRWHLSLTSFFRDYVYIPLGGKKKHQIRNIAIVFLLTGIWHGASSCYLFWGAFHGFFRIAEKLLEKPFALLTGNIPRSLRTVIGRVYTLLVVLIGWVFFRIGALKQSFTWVLTMFGLRPTESAVCAPWYLDTYSVTIFILCIIGCTPAVKKVGSALLLKLPEKVRLPVQYLCILTLLFVCIMKVATGSYTAFIYFQF